MHRILTLNYLGFFTLILVNNFSPCNASGSQTVPGTSNLWLAGMPAGSVAGVNTRVGYSGDTAPEESPVQVGGIAISADENFSFSASGLVSQGNGTPAFGPDGNTGGITSLDDGAVNGLASITAPFDALVGVFLDGSQPSSFSPPGALDFSTQSERDFQSLSPALRQTFYIGDGLTSASIVQHFLAPAGATRLFLGTMDSYQWANNTGMYTVTVAGFPTILGDANLDGKVDLNDLNVVLNHLGLTDSLRRWQF